MTERYWVRVDDIFIPEDQDIEKEFNVIVENQILEYYGDIRTAPLAIQADVFPSSFVTPSSTWWMTFRDWNGNKVSVPIGEHRLMFKIPIPNNVIQFPKRRKRA